jgi:two-component system sensor histidine kinase/response regulator
MTESPIKKDKGNILVVDDLPENLHVLVRMLNDQGYKVRPTRSGSQALLVARTAPPDLILLDIIMPEMNGYEVCQQLKADEQTCDIPVIFITALNEVLNKVKAFSIGGVDYITKPFQIEEVIARVETHLSLRNLQKRFQEQNEWLMQEIKDREEIEQILQKRVDELAKARKNMFKMMDDLEKAKNQANAAKEIAERANQAKSEFLANISHEIRTPINAIMGLTQITLNTALTHEQRDYLTQLDSSSESLLEIINDLLDLAKIEAGKFNLESIPFCLDDILQDLSYLLRIKSEEKGLALRINVDGKVPRDLRGDALRLKQILLNLTTNAIKFTETGEININVKLVSMEKEGIKLHFSVKDRGIGIAQETLSHLFEPFTQADASTTRQFGGTGLGLTICKQLTKMMGGEIWVDSQLGKGSTFHFTVVFEQQLEASNSVLQTENKTTAKSLKGKRILLVEDNPMNQLVAQKIMEGQGLVVEIADNGKKAVAMVAETDFDAVLMDIQMPEMDGYEATQFIRKNPQYHELPVIAMTAHAMSDVREKCLAAGMNDYITKPFKKAQLFEILEKWTTPSTVIQECAVISPTFETDSPLTERLLPDKLPGFDLAENIKMLGERPLYRLLQKFYTDYQNIVETMKSLLEKGDIEKAKDLLHNLKGLSGNLGISSLYPVTKDFEKALKAGDDISEPFQQFEVVVADVMKTLVSLKADKRES